MAATNDTIDGLLAEFRGYAAGMPASYHVTMSWADFRKMLDRFDAAHKREVDALKQRITELDAEVAAKDEVIKRLNDALAEEQRRSGQVGNAAKLREALMVVRDAIYRDLTTGRLLIATDVNLEDVVSEALAAPVRNCDVGTADEQLKRFLKKWESVGYGEIDEIGIHMMSIFSRWAQLRYGSEVKDGSK